MGRGDANNASQFGRIVALCDVDDSQLSEAKKLRPDAETNKDFRKVIPAIALRPTNGMAQSKIQEGNSMA